MKIRLLLALVGLAISSVLPTFAQQTNTPDLWQWAGTWVFHCRTVTSRNSLLSVDFWSTTSPFAVLTSIRSGGARAF